MVCGALEYCPSLHGLLGQARIRGGWREVRWQKTSVLELGQSRRKESVEKRGRERERPVFLGLCGKPIKPLYRACTTQEGTGHPLEEVLKAWAGK